jgi:hypothetical protein
MLWLCILLLTPGSRLSAPRVIGTLNGLVVILLHLNPSHEDFVASPVRAHVTKRGPRRVLAGLPKLPLPWILFPVRPKNFPVWFQREFSRKSTIEQENSERAGGVARRIECLSPLFSRFTGILRTAGATEAEGRD